MPAFETADRYQAVVYWPALGVNDYGQYTVGDPEPIMARWVPKRREQQDAQRRPIIIDVTVVVDFEVPIGSRMWLGELEDWLGTGSSIEGLDDEQDVFEVRSYNETVDIKGRVLRRSVNLSRFKAEVS